MLGPVIRMVKAAFDAINGFGGELAGGGKLIRDVFDVKFCGVKACCISLALGEG